VVPRVTLRSAVRLVTACIVSSTLSGCFAITMSYVDPQLPKVSYSDLNPRTDRRPLHLTENRQKGVHCSSRELARSF
jgi:hypothetical protein